MILLCAYSSSRAMRDASRMMLVLVSEHIRDKRLCDGVHRVPFAPHTSNIPRCSMFDGPRYSYASNTHLSRLTAATQRRILLKKCPVFFLCVCLLHFVRCQLCTHHTPAIQHQPHASFFIQHHKKTKRTSKTWNIKQQRLLLLRVLLLYQPEIMLNNPIHSSI